MIKLYNTLKRKKQIFRPLKGKRVGIYSCGPTVYSYAHIGNLRTYIFNDILKRVLEYNGYNVKHVMNITDVGHLTSDADTGEDKLEKAAKKEKKTAWQIAEFYASAFKADLKRLDIIEPNIWAKATSHIEEQIRLIRKLENKGYAYRTKDGIYFDTSKIKDYGKLAGLKKKGLKPGARVELIKEKRNITDFALWKFSPKEEKRQMEWNSPWGIGFPGWHTECVAMGIKYLGIPFDIHTGAIDLIPTHHTNETAQAEAANGKELAKYWLHGEHLVLKEGKMAKSEGNIIMLDDLIKKGFDPLAYRYLCLTTHYRSKLNFSWESLKAGQNALDNLRGRITAMQGTKNNYSRERKEFIKYVSDDLDTPKALALMWKLIKENRADKGLISNFDKVFGLRLNKSPKEHEDNAGIKNLVAEREKYRKEKNWHKSDELRKKIEKQGYLVEDTPKGPKIKKAPNRQG